MKLEKKRMSLWVPLVLYNRIESDSRRYGVAKTFIVQTAITNYYRSLDNEQKTSVNRPDGA